MKSKKTRIAAFVMAAILAAAMAATPESDAATNRTYEVTITNLTPGRPIAPPLLVAHAGFFTVGMAAGDELQQLAENGNAELLAAKLGGMAGIQCCPGGGTAGSGK